MTDDEIIELDIPPSCLREARDLVNAVERVNRTRINPHDLTEILVSVADDPITFVMEGGSDGTFAHLRFHDEYGDLLPEIADLGAVVAGARGMGW